MYSMYKHLICTSVFLLSEFQSLIAKVESKQVRGVNLKAQQIKEILIHTPGIINTGKSIAVIWCAENIINYCC